MAGSLWRFVLDCILSGFGDLSIRFDCTRKIFLARSNTETGMPRPALSATIIRINGATIGRESSNACGKVFDGYADPKLLHLILPFRLKHGARFGLVKSRSTAATMALWKCLMNTSTNCRPLSNWNGIVSQESHGIGSW